MQARDQLRRQRQIEKQQEREAASAPANSANNNSDEKKKNNTNNKGEDNKDPNDVKNGGQGYTVVISGLSTDLATIYRDAIPRFLLPRIPIASQHQEFQQQQQTKNKKEKDNNNNKNKKDKDQNENDNEDEDNEATTSSPSMLATTMRPVQPSTIAFRLETCSAFVSIPKNEAEKATRNTKNSNNNDKEASSPNNSSSSSSSIDIANFCNNRDLFGQRVKSLAALSNHDQSSLVSVSAYISKTVSTKQLTSALSPIEGFVSVIPIVNNHNQTSSSSNNNNKQQKQEGNSSSTADNTNTNNKTNNKTSNNAVTYSKFYRLVFKNEKSLFGAKKLLDEFPAAEGVNVKVSLNDSSMRKFLEFLQMEDAETNENDAVVLSHGGIPPVAVTDSSNTNNDDEE